MKKLKGVIKLIKSFKDEDTAKVYRQEYVNSFPENVCKVALRKLIMINAARDERDFRVPPGNHFERLQGDRLGQCSIRINDKYRICFRIVDNDCYDVEITNYH